VEQRKAEEPELSTAERRLYVSFFENLGISDEKQTFFLSTLLRNVFEASAKLDLHLAPHGASLHSAISRMQVSVNPQEAPTHRWIRVVDRLGFFSDSNSHAERIVNIGLAYAYRHLEVDALAGANAILMSKVQATTPQTVDGDEVVLLPVGGVNVAETSGGAGEDETADGADGPPPIDDPLPREDGESAAEGALPDGGVVFPILPPARAFGAASVGGPSASVGGSIVTTVTTGGVAAAGGPPAGAGQEAPLPSGGIEFTLDGAPPVAATTEGELDADEEEDQAGSASSILPHVIYDRQPTVVPNALAVETVRAVLAGLQDRFDGMAVLRQLLDDSVNVLGRSTPRPMLKPNGKLFPTGAKGDRLALFNRTGGWWPQWRAPHDLPNSLPPVGTVAHVLNPHRPSVSSRWVILVDMSCINDSIKALSIRSARFFTKKSLVPFEMVQRIWGKAPLRLPVVLACMLLLVTKEEGYGTTLAHLAATGRGAIPKNNPLVTASCHEFNTPGISAPVAPTFPLGGPTNDHPRAVPPPARPPNSTAQAEDYSQQYAEMDAALAVEDTAVKTKNRANRVRARTARAVKALARPTAAGSAPPPAAAHSSAAPQSTAAGSSSQAAIPPAVIASTAPTTSAPMSSKRPPASSRAQAAGALAPRPIIKRARKAKGKSSAGIKASATPSTGSSGGAAACGAAVGGGGRGAPLSTDAGAAATAAAGAQVEGAGALVCRVHAPAAAAAASAGAGVAPVQAVGVPAGIAAGCGIGSATPVVGGQPQGVGSVHAGTSQPSGPTPVNLLLHGVAHAAATTHVQSDPPSLFSPPFSPVPFSPTSIFTGSHSANAADAPASAPPVAHSAADFAQEQRMRRERVNADLLAAHASVSDILSARHQSWGNGGGGA